MEVVEADLWCGSSLEVRSSLAVLTASSAPSSPGITESILCLAVHMAWIRVEQEGWTTTSGCRRTAFSRGWGKVASLETSAVSLRLIPRPLSGKWLTLARTELRKGPSDEGEASTDWL